MPVRRGEARMVKLFWCPNCSTRTNHVKIEFGWQCRVCEYIVDDVFAKTFIEVEEKKLGEYIVAVFRKEGLIMKGGNDGR